MSRFSPRLIHLAAVPLCLATALLAACATEPASAEGRQALQLQAKATISHFKAESPAIAKAYFGSAKGYAVFPSVGKGGFVIGAAHGQGVLFQDGKLVGYCSLSQGTIGAQIGGQDYSEIIFFQNDMALNTFKAGDLEADAQATAVAAQSDAAANASYSHGVAIVTFNSQGLMAEAVVGGQKFSYQPKPSK